MHHLVVDIAILLSVQVAVFGRSPYSPSTGNSSSLMIAPGPIYSNYNVTDHCHHPDDLIAKFQTNCDDTDVDGKCPFTCDNNFIPKANGILTCKVGGEWVPEKPYCEEPSTTTPPALSISTASVPTTSALPQLNSTTPLPGPMCCPNRTAREIQWGHCGKSENVTRPCPKESVGEAWWFCNTTKGEWIPSTPNLESCKSGTVDEIINKINDSQVDKALELLRGINPRYGGDLLAVGDKLTKVVQNIEEYLRALPPENRRDEANNITDQVTSLGDSMLSGTDLWKDLTKEKLVKAATNLLEDEEITAFQCAYNLNASETKFLSMKSFTMQIVKGENGNYEEGLSLPLSSAYSSSKTTKFFLPPNFEKAIDDPQSNETIVVFFEYKDLGDLLVMQSSEVSTSTSAEKKSEVSTSTSAEKKSEIFLSSSGEKRSEDFSSSSAVNSPVLSVSLNKHNLNVTFKDLARFTVSHISKNADRPVCAFWNADSLNWDTKGCKLVREYEDYTECVCDHLTNFAVLMDIHGVVDTLSQVDLDRLEAITLVGCMISIVFLSVAIVVTTVYKNLWGIRNNVHRNLAICLMIGETILLAGGGGSENKMLCPFIAGLLHYFFTAAFCWMFLEAVVIYLLLFVPYSPEKTYRKRFWAFGYGVPGLIVFISFISRPSGYGSDTHCWLNKDDGFMWSFVGPVTLILTVNIVALIYAIYVMKTGKMIQNKMGPPVTKKWILEALAYVPFLGTTWIIGFAMVKSQAASVYAFTVLNSLQGFAIFVFQCLLDQDSLACLVKSFHKYTYLSDPDKADSPVSPGASETYSANHASPGGTETNAANQVSPGGTETDGVNHLPQGSASEASPQPNSNAPPEGPRCSHKSQSSSHPVKPEAQNSVPTAETEAHSQSSSLSTKDSDTESSRKRNSTNSSGNDVRTAQRRSPESSQTVPTQDSTVKPEDENKESTAETEAPSLPNKYYDNVSPRIRNSARSIGDDITTAEAQGHSSESSQNIPVKPNYDFESMKVGREVFL